MVIDIVMHAVFPRLQAAQLDLSFPTRLGTRGVKGVVHPAIFFDGIRLGHIVSVNVEVLKLTFREHLRVVESGPLLPVLFFLRSQSDLGELGSGFGPGELSAKNSTRAER